MKNILQGGACLFVETSAGHIAETATGHFVETSTGHIAETATGHFVETVTEKIADGLLDESVLRGKSLSHCGNGALFSFWKQPLVSL